MTGERYTAVFTGLLPLKEPGEYTYLDMEENPSGSEPCTITRGRPPYGELGRKISFSDLPEGCKRLVLDTYRKMWNL